MIVFMMDCENLQVHTAHDKSGLAVDTTFQWKSTGN